MKLVMMVAMRWRGRGVDSGGGVVHYGVETEINKKTCFIKVIMVFIIMVISIKEIMNNNASITTGPTLSITSADTFKDIWLIYLNFVVEYSYPVWSSAV